MWNNGDQRLERPIFVMKELDSRIMFRDKQLLTFIWDWNIALITLLLSSPSTYERLQAVDCCEWANMMIIIAGSDDVANDVNYRFKYGIISQCWLIGILLRHHTKYHIVIHAVLKAIIWIRCCINGIWKEFQRTAF